MFDAWKKVQHILLNGGLMVWPKVKNHLEEIQAIESKTIEGWVKLC